MASNPGDLNVKHLTPPFTCQCFCKWRRSSMTCRQGIIVPNCVWYKKHARLQKCWKLKSTSCIHSRNYKYLEVNYEFPGKTLPWLHEISKMMTKSNNLGTLTWLKLENLWLETQTENQILKASSNLQPWKPPRFQSVTSTHTHTHKSN